MQVLPRYDNLFGEIAQSVLAKSEEQQVRQLSDLIRQPLELVLRGVENLQLLEAGDRTALSRPRR